MDYENETPASFISPVVITPAMITSSTAVTHLPSEALWSATTSYTVGQIVYRTINNVDRRYENQIPGVNSNPPEDDQNRWYDLGPTDKMSMFDGMINTQSIAPNTLTVIFRPGAFNAAYLGNLDGRSVQLIVKESPGGPESYNKTVSLDDAAPADYYEYFFNPFRQATDFTATGLTPFANSEVTIVVSNPGGVARAGVASLGRMVSLLAPPERGAKVKSRNYTRTTTDSRGVTTYRKGRKARDLSFTITIPIEQGSNIADEIDDVSDIPCAVIGGDIDYLRALRGFGLLNYEANFRNIDVVMDITVQGTI